MARGLYVDCSMSSSMQNTDIHYVVENMAYTLYSMAFVLAPEEWVKYERWQVHVLLREPLKTASAHFHQVPAVNKQSAARLKASLWAFQSSRNFRTNAKLLAVPSTSPLPVVPLSCSPTLSCDVTPVNVCKLLTGAAPMKGNLLFRRKNLLRWQLHQRPPTAGSCVKKCLAT